ncbi:hypothetical protein BGZ83_011974 [Gryganskiella cystojenkinii]|nr:hypothetical protein BGZ83_011974 [Gryganskiella cystojenkinii]
MDMLANYASSESDSDREESITSPVIQFRRIQDFVVQKEQSPTPGTEESNPVTELGDNDTTEPSPAGPHVTGSSTALRIPSTTPPTGQAEEDVIMDGGDDRDEEFVSSSLKFLQDFAASVDEKSSPDSDMLTTADPMNTVECAATTIHDSNLEELVMSKEFTTEPDRIQSPTKMTPEQQELFDAFMARIDALPLTTKDQTRPPLSSSPLRPETPSTLESRLAAQEKSGQQWLRTASIQSIYSRIHQLSRLLSPLIQQETKNLEKSLVKFAIRILDWEKGGLRPGYFLGEERAAALDRRNNEIKKNDVDDDKDENEDDQMDIDEDGEENGQEDRVDEVHDQELPPHGGIVGDMIETMTKVEQQAVPSGWKVVWDAVAGSYSFLHLASVSTVMSMFPPYVVAI